MATIDENLRTQVLADSTVKEYVATRMFYNHVPERVPKPFIYYQQTGTVSEAAMDDSQTGPHRYQFAVECVDDDLATSRALAARVQTLLNPYRGTFGDTTIRGCFAEDAADDYVPRSIGMDSGEHVTAIQVEVVP